MSKHSQLVVQQRDIIGRKVSQLRNNGLTPANIYGLQAPSRSVAVPSMELKKLMSQVGESEIIEITLENESSSVPVLVSGVQRDPVSRDILHVDFRQVDLSKEVTVSVEVVFEGEPPITKSGQAVLLELVNEIEVTALPDKLPSEIVIDVSALENIGDQLTLADIPLEEGVVIVADDLEQLICKLDAVNIADEEEGAVEEEASENEEAPEEEGAGSEGDSSTPEDN